MDKKIAYYICEGCGIGDALDIDELESVATGEMKVPVCKRHERLCSDEGVALIQNDIDNEEVNAVIIGACSAREHQPRFDFGKQAIVERINLREQVVWSHDPSVLEEDFEEEDGEENLNEMAQDYTRMGVIKMNHMDPLEPFIPDTVTKKVLVIGGGVAGMSAALNVAKAGREAILVEKKDELGGWATNLYRRLPFGADYTQLSEPNLGELVEEVNGNEKVTVYTGKEVAKISGMPGDFQVELSGGESDTVGAIIVAAGWKPFDTAKFDEKYQYGKNKNVITSVELEEMIKKDGKITRPSDGGDVEIIAFVTSVQTTDGDQSPYMGNVADIVALKQAFYLKEQNEAATPYLFHEHVKAPGLYEDLFREVQKGGLRLVRGELNGISEGDEHPLMLEGEDIFLNEAVMMEADLVVLSVGMQPVTLDEEILHLTYRQGPELPQLSHGYPNSHFICFPYETQRTGIYTCGSVREPMELGRSCDDAAGAALKAVQTVELLSEGKAVHPRVGDLSFPDFALQRCTQCKRCTEECPFGALDEDEKGTPKPNTTRCRRCGTCMGACPERIISFKNYSVGMIGSMIKSLPIPDEFDEKPRVIILACENDAMPALDMAGQNKMQYSSYVRTIPLRCLGSVNLVWIADSLSKGYDGVMLLGCKHGDNYQCHFVKGSELCSTRMEKVSETLERLMLEPERINFQEINITDYKKVPGMINDFIEELIELGPNPYKD